MQAQPLAPVLNETDQLGDDKTALGGRLRHYQPSPRLKVAVARLENRPGVAWDTHVAENGPGASEQRTFAGADEVDATTVEPEETPVNGPARTGFCWRAGSRRPWIR